VHHHGVGIHVDIALALRGYQIYSWSNRLKGNPSLREMRVRTKACLMGGVDETTFGQASPADIVQQSREAIAETNGRGFILAPGCAVPTPPESPAENLAAFRAAVVAA
jgi:uroporphyrinogen-III decarboxylase